MFFDRLPTYTFGSTAKATSMVNLHEPMRAANVEQSLPHLWPETVVETSTETSLVARKVDRSSSVSSHSSASSADNGKGVRIDVSEMADMSLTSGES
jgi:hypothetical protein